MVVDAAKIGLSALRVRYLNQQAEYKFSKVDSRIIRKNTHATFLMGGFRPAPQLYLPKSVSARLLQMRSRVVP